MTGTAAVQRREPRFHHGKHLGPPFGNMFTEIMHAVRIDGHAKSQEVLPAFREVVIRSYESSMRENFYE